MRQRLMGISLSTFIAAIACSTTAAAQDGAENASAAPAQVSQASDGLTVGDIVVTAQRREERLQDVPIAIAAIGSDTLSNNRVLSTQDLQVTVPTLVYSSTGLYAQPFLRGIGSDLTFPNADPSVATYIDGVFVSNNSATIQSLLGTDRVEILSGPQGTLYGRNAVAGAINVYTMTPDEDFEGSLSATYGNYDLMEVGGRVSGPVSDTLFVGVYGAYSRRDTYLKSTPQSLDDLDHETSSGVRLKAVWVPSDAVKFTASVEHLESKGFEGGAFRNVQENSLAQTLGASPIMRKYLIDSNFPQRAITNQEGYSLRSEFDLGGVQLVSLSAYRDFNGFGANDTDGSSLPIFEVNSTNFSKQFSQELQLLSPSGSRISWIAGLYYFREHTGFEPFNIFSPVFFAPLGGQQNTVQEVHLKSYAAFAQATIPLGEYVRLTAGGRYTSDKKSYDAEFVFLDAALNPVPGTETVFPTRKKTWNRFTPKVTLDFKKDDLLLYASYSQGFKAGAFNLPSPAAPGPVNPEILNSWEIGVKTDLFDRRLRFNAAGYYYKYKNIQVSRIDIGGSGATVLQNAASARTYGVEATATAVVSRSLTLNGSVAWNDAKYSDFANASSATLTPFGNLPTAVDASGNYLIRAPKWVFSAAANYEHRFDNDAALRASLSLYHNGGFYWDTANSLRQKSYNLVNATIGYSFPGDKFAIDLFARNLTNQYYRNSLNVFPTAVVSQDAPPRMYGITARMKLGG